jgi:hypothetical protein
MSGSAGWPRRGRLNGRAVPPTNDDPDPAGQPPETGRTIPEQQPGDEPDPDDDDEVAGLRLVLHVPFVAADLAEGAVVGRMLARSLRAAGAAESVEVDVAEATLTVEGDQVDHRRLFCDRLLGPGRRCVLREGHTVPCHPGREAAA